MWWHAIYTLLMILIWRLHWIKCLQCKPFEMEKIACEMGFCWLNWKVSKWIDFEWNCWSIISSIVLKHILLGSARKMFWITNLEKEEKRNVNRLSCYVGGKVSFVLKEETVLGLLFIVLYIHAFRCVLSLERISEWNNEQAIVVIFVIYEYIKC